ncbi:1-(5-phosphoribosyl)-5-[(5-phosphoribosylamino)methylideneamino]imidazole-4-carboxamide isomerase [Alkaliphilus crotonatoxidans]
MIIYPAIDIKGGKCVRLTQGLKNQEKVYYDWPQEVARLWQEKGARWLHVVDLDGAFGGRARNYEIVKEMVTSATIPIQIGGGIRSLENIEAWLALGIKRVILGTKALEDPVMLKEALKRFSEEIVVSIDAKNGLVTTEGWVKTSSIKAVDFAMRLEEQGVRRIVYTDISRDGMLSGPNFEALENLKGAVGLEIIASGGISSLKDLTALQRMGIEGAIVGKALYEGRIDLAELGEFK